MRPILKYSILVSLLVHGTAYSINLSTDNPSSNQLEKTVLPKNTSAITNSSNDKKVSTVIVPINGIPTPINITLNPTPSAPVTTAKDQLTVIKKPVLAPNTRNKITIPPIPSLDIVINKKYYNSTKVIKLYRMLGIKHSPKIIHLVADKSVANVKDSIIYVNIRSFVNVLAFLSNSVQVLPFMLQQKLVIAPKNPDGSYFNLNLLTKGLLNIHISSKKPQYNVNLKVFYRNYWFYIMDNDYKSKRTLSMIEQLFNLQAGEIKGQTSPVLTIPVATAN